MDIDIEKVKEIVLGAKPLFENREQSQRVTVKGAADFVTQVDFEVQNYFQEKLKNLYPETEFLSEEKDNSDIDFSGYVWILDPVDGTTNLIHDFQGSSISLGLAKNKEVIMGIIYVPTSGELFYAKKGEGAYLNGERIHCSSVSDLAGSLIGTGPGPYRKDWADLSFDMYKKIYKDVSDIRRIGSAAIELSYVACGRMEAYIEPRLNPWDFCAGLLIVEEAGGKLQTFDGDKMDVSKATSMCASNAVIGDILVKDYLPGSDIFK